VARGDDIIERLLEFGAGVIKMCELIPESKASNLIVGQLLRCSTSPAANYAEARGAESDRDFVHKLGIVLKELNESLVWL
jgi:four helix bundle protein